MATEKDVKTLIVGQSVNDLENKAIVLFDKDTGDPTAFDALKLFNGEDKTYGVEWYTGTTSTFTEGNKILNRIGNSELHRLLPIQSRMRGCLLNDDGTVREYLTPNAWEAHDLTGAKGQVMVEVPAFWVKYEDDLYSGTTRRRAIRISEEYFVGSTLSPMFYIGAYEAFRDSNNKLCSIASSTNTLILPTTSIGRGTARRAARNRNNSANAKWNIKTYECWKAIFWLYTVEYANRNCQDAFTNVRTANGWRQGGLGIGLSNMVAADWNTYNGYNPITKCGESNSLGNNSGEVKIAASLYPNLVIANNEICIPRYRGIEHPFGHIWEWCEGANVDVNANYSTLYVTNDPTKFSDSSNDNYEARGNEARANGYRKNLIFGAKGEIIASEIGGSSNSYWCDYYYQDSTTTGLKGVFIGGPAYDGLGCGFGCSRSAYAPSSTVTFVGSRLCYLP